MNRRAMLAMAGIALLSPRIAFAQTPGRVYRVAFVGVQPTTLSGPYRDRLAERGYVEGRNLELRSFSPPDATPEDFTGTAREVLAWKPDVIRVFGTKNARLMGGLISTIPIIFDSVSDPVASGLVASFARPGGNLTGVSVMNDQLIAKRIELVRDLLPRAKRVALLIDSSYKAISAEALQAIHANARRMGLTLEVFDPSREARHVVGALESIAKTRPDAAVWGIAGVDTRDFAALGIRDGTTSTNLWSKILVDFQRTHRIPAIAASIENLDFGVIASLGQSQQEQGQITADQSAKIFSGKPFREIPVEQITRIVVGINLKTAKELGIKVPESVLVRADRIVQ